jgi:hypothetical protein
VFVNEYKRWEEQNGTPCYVGRLGAAQDWSSMSGWLDAVGVQYQTAHTEHKALREGTTT